MAAVATRQGRGLSWTMSRYIARQFLLIFLAILLIFCSVILMIDLIELLRRSSGKAAATFSIVLQMAVYKLPLTAQKALPFAVLFSGMLAFWRLNRNSELVALRAAGVSVWQFLLPVVAATLIVGLTKVMVVNPLGTNLIAQYERMNNLFLKHRQGALASSSSGIWLRQSSERGDVVIHASTSKMTPRGLTLSRVLVLLYSSRDQFQGRVDGDTAVLRNGHWELTPATVRLRGSKSRKVDTFRIPTDLTIDRIQESFSAPAAISFWDLPAFIRSLEATGFSALSHRLHWHSLIAEPLLYCAMILIAAIFSLRHNRRTGVLLSAAGGVGAGFLLFFVADLVVALAHSTGMPPPMAAWAPSLAFSFVGLAVLLHVEDG